MRKTLIGLLTFLVFNFAVTVQIFLPTQQTQALASITSSQVTNQVMMKNEEVVKNEYNKYVKNTEKGLVTCTTVIAIILLVLILPIMFAGKAGERMHKMFDGKAGERMHKIIISIIILLLLLLLLLPFFQNFYGWGKNGSGKVANEAATQAQYSY